MPKPHIKHNKGRQQKEIGCISKKVKVLPVISSLGGVYGSYPLLWRTIQLTMVRTLRQRTRTNQRRQRTDGYTTFHLCQRTSRHP